MRTWNRFRVFRTPLAARALGTPDIIIPVALGADPPIETEAPLWDLDAHGYVRPVPPPDGWVRKEHEWAWFPQAEENAPHPTVVQAARTAGIVPATAGQLLRHIDIDAEIADDLVEQGVDMNHWAPLQALKWGFNLAALPDSLGSRYYLWYIVHPWPKLSWWSWPPDDVENRDAEARNKMHRGKLFVRS